MLPELVLIVPGNPETLTGGYVYDRRIVAGLRALGWKVAVEVLDETFPVPSANALAAARRVLAGIPNERIVLIDGLALGGMPAVVAAESVRLRLVGLIHHPLADETGLEPVQAEALRRAERQALAAMRAVIVTSAATAAALAAYDVPADRIVVVEPGTDPAPLARGSGGPGLALLCVATFIPRKGHSVLFEALAELIHHDWTLECIGSLHRSPETVARLRELVRRLGLSERVALSGEMDGPMLARRYDRADLFVLATFHEGYGMALAEALARGLPVISTRVGAVPHTVPEDAGLLVPAGDRVALADALDRMLSDANLRARLAAGARHACAALPTWDVAAARMAQALERASISVERLHG
jgi:glycosyltransferase involved in cell wall biosynthesis